MAQASRHHVHGHTGKQPVVARRMPQVTQPDVQQQFASAATMPFEG